MPVSTFSSREFNHDIGRAKKAAEKGPVFITDRGKPAHVLLNIETYRKLTGGEMTLREALAQNGDFDIEFEPPRFAPSLGPADLS